MEEIFKDIEGFPGYYISNLGNIMSRKRGETHILSQIRSKYGYQEIMFYQNKKMHTLYVARLVLAAFKGYPADPWLCFAHHIDGDKSNCRLDNLEWLICETTDEYDPTKSHRRGVLRPDETKTNMTNAKYNQSVETIRKIVEARQKTIQTRNYLK